MVFALTLLISMLTVKMVVTNASQEDVFTPTGDFHMTSDLTTDARNEETTNSFSMTSEVEDQPVIPYSIRILIICFSVIGVTANGFVIFVFIKSSKLRKQLTSVFLINQSSEDLVTGVFIILIHIQYKLSNSVGSKIVCKLIISEWPLWTCLHMSTLNLLVITIERYVMIMHPIIHKNSFTKTKAYITVIAILLFSVMASIFIFTSSGLVGDKCMRYYFWVWPEAEPVLFFNSLLWIYFIPLIAMVVVYICIFQKVRRKNRVLQSTNSAMVEICQIVQVKNKAKQEMSILKTAVMICVCFFICYTPSVLKVLLYNMGTIDGLKTDTYWAEIPELLMYGNCGINPFIYIFRYNLFRQEALSILNIK